jgi:hypothetical protein
MPPQYNILVSVADFDATRQGGSEPLMTRPLQWYCISGLANLST